jgi:Sigma-54 interaction domain
VDLRLAALPKFGVAANEQLIVQIASTPTTVITGESGTGKELVARAIHARSECASHPFMAINGARPSLRQYERPSYRNARYFAFGVGFPLDWLGIAVPAVEGGEAPA